MGIEIDREDFSPQDEAAFDARLQGCLQALRALLEGPGFGVGPTTIGAELELDLIDADAEPAPIAPALLASRGAQPWAPELTRFNLEINTAPTPLRGAPFATMRRRLAEHIAAVDAAASAYGAHAIAIGILPTLRRDSLGPGVMSGGRRYAAVAKALKRRHGGPFAVEIQGPKDALAFEADEVTVEGASTSFQVHLRVDPGAFARTYNAAQLATAPALAMAANSPLLFGHRLWDESRIALYRQSVDERPLHGVSWQPSRVSFGHGFVRQGPLELFAEAVGLHRPLLPVCGDEDPLLALRRFVDGGAPPRLAELRLQQGTVWHWNRAIYDDADGGHTRIEFRALPAGPTPIDMAANAALLIGLTLAIAQDSERWLASLTFGHARRNFYHAARHGLDAELVWPQGPSGRPGLMPVVDVVAGLLRDAADALVDAGVERADAEAALAPIAGRVAARQTGARWQAAATTSGQSPRHIVQTYSALAASGEPVHGW